MCIFQGQWLWTSWHQDTWLKLISDLWRTYEHSSLFWLVPRCWEDTNTRPPSLIKTREPKQRWDSLSFLSLPDIPSVIFYHLFYLVNSALTSSGLCILFLSARSQKHSWLVLWNPLWVLGLSQPPSIQHKGMLETLHVLTSCIIQCWSGGLLLLFLF